MNTRVLSLRSYMRGLVSLVAILAVFLVGSRYYQSRVDGGSKLVSRAAPNIFNGVDQDLLSQCIAEGIVNCAGTVPGLQECMKAGNQCNRSMLDEINRTRIAASQAYPGAMSKDEAEEAARRQSTDSAAAKNAVVISKEMTLSDYSALVKSNISPMLNRSTLVWVVTVHAPALTDGGTVAAPREVPEYTVVMDAVAHQGILVAFGEATLG